MPETFQPGEYRKFITKYAYVIGFCGADVVMGLTGDCELLLDLNTGERVHSLDYVPGCPMPPNDWDELYSFDWKYWSKRVRSHIKNYGPDPYL